jgi:RNA polymerase sigma-70 factor (ECF subfamily)
MESDSRLLLLKQVRLGNRAALGQLLESLRPYIRVIVNSQRGSRRLTAGDDSDLIQDALVQASQSIATFQGVTLGEWLAWLRTITVRTTYRTLNSSDQLAANRVSSVSLATLVSDKQIDPRVQAVQHENANRIALALARLPDEMQQVLLGRLVNDLDHADLAIQLNRSAGAVRMLYLRALRRLREVWQTEFSSATGEFQ